MKKVLFFILALFTILICSKNNNIYSKSTDDFEVDYSKLICTSSKDRIYEIQIDKKANLRILGNHAVNSNTLVTYQTVGFTFTDEKTHGKVSDYMKAGKNYYCFRYGNTVDKMVTDKNINGEIRTTYEFPDGTLVSALKGLDLFNDKEALRKGVTVYMSNIFILKTRKTPNQSFVPKKTTYFDLELITKAAGWRSNTLTRLPHYYDMEITVRLEGNSFKIIIEDTDGKILDSSREEAFVEKEVKKVALDNFVDSKKNEYSFDNRYYLVKDDKKTKIYETEKDTKELSIQTNDEEKLEVHLIYKLINEDIPDELEESDETKSLFSKSLTKPEQKLIIEADFRENEKFDVTKGIPTSEDLYANIFCKDELIAYEINIRSGLKNYPVNVQKTYTLSWQEAVEVEISDDESSKEENNTGSGTNNSTTQRKTKIEYRNRYETVTVNSTVVIPREYCFYEIGNFSYYVIDNAKINSKVLENEELVLTPKNNYFSKHNVDYNHSTNLSDHIIDPITSISINGGTLYGGYSRPYAPSATYAEVDARVEKIKVKNDYLSVNGFVVLDNAICIENAKLPNRLTDNFEKEIDKDVLFESNLTIPSTLQNGFYKADGSLKYTKLYDINSTTNQDLEYPISIKNHIKIHSPIICEPLIYTDNDSFVQLENPKEDINNLVLSVNKDKSDFEIFVSNYGTHLGIKGYGVRDYKKYKFANFIRFPFDVSDYEKDLVIEKGNWIEIGENKLHFYLPIWVDEGIYEVECLSIANNSELINELDRKGKTNIDDKAMVSAEILGSEITYENFSNEQLISNDELIESLIEKLNNQKINSQKYANYDSAFSIAHNTISVQISGSIENLALYDALEYFDVGKVKKLGETVMFRFDTTGSFDGFNASLKLTPSFYFIDNKDFARKEVDIYYIDESQKERTLIKVGSNEDSRRKKYYVTGNNNFDIPKTSIMETAFLDGMKYSDFCLQKLGLFYYGKVRVPHSLRMFLYDLEYSLFKKTKDLDRARFLIDNKDTIKSRQRWYGEYYLPENCIIVDKGENVVKNIGKKKEGYLIVNFDIKTDNNHEKYTLDYVNTKNNIKYGHCSMWDEETIEKLVELENGNSFILFPGDLIIYDTSKLLQEEFYREVTH